MVAGATSAVRALVRLVRERFGRNTGEAEVLEAALAHPDDQQRRTDLAAVLAETMLRDPTFAEQVQVHWRAVSAELTVDHGGVVNQFSGQAEKVIQARDVDGDISF
jgi:hypothetical protein